jgi:hypothetical protein
MLRKVLVGKITCTPLVMDGRRGFRMTGNVTFAPFLKGDVWEAVRSEQPDGGGPNGMSTVIGQALTFQIRGIAYRH